ncbi:MAG TPA: pitrilysin family protein [Verrucomicrobiae bacterium]|nr:pitrilysin family protein [Verrucomicrobiae bacterium]
MPISPKRGARVVSHTRLESAPTLPPGVRLSALANGLTLILREDHSAPVVSAQAWCRAGSINEGSWLGAGLSHVLEHMLFKGTTSRASGAIDQEVQEAGGYMNAYTSFDRTVYWINVPNTGSSVAISVLCDIMQHATLPEEELVKELDVIRREMDMNQDDPGQRSARRLFETAYTRSPYRFPIIGYADIFNEVRRVDIERYYREKYAPNNLFFVVVGDFDAAEVEAQIQTAFASSRMRAVAPAVLPDEPRQMAARETAEEAPIELGHLHLSWHIPELRHPDVPLLDVFAALLGAGRSSRLYREVRQKRGLVTSVDAWLYSPGNPGLFGMSATMEPAKFQLARQAMLDELERMRSKLVSRAELEKAIKQFVAGTLANRKTMQGQAQDLGSSWIATGDLNFSERYLEAVKRVTPEALKRVARLYLTEENRTSYALLPQGTSPRSASIVALRQEHAVQKLELKNGLRVLVKEDHRLPFVEFRLVGRGGVLAENTQDNGATMLLSRLLLQGTQQRTAEQIATQIESIGGHLDTYGGNNSFGLSAEVLNTDWVTGLDLVADVLLRPAFPAAAVELERQIQLAAIRAQRDDLLASASRLMRRTLFGPSGYGLAPHGTETSVQALQVSQLQALHAKLVTARNCVLAVFGDVHIRKLESGLRTKFAAWKGGQALTPAVLLEADRGAGHAVEHRDKKQTVLVVGFPGTTFDHPDRFALDLLQEACSDMGSRLFLRIRDKLGLAYYVGAQNFPGLIPGYFCFYVGTDPAKAELVERELLKESDALREHGLTEEELKRAQAKLIGQRKIARQDLGSYASTVALDELYGLGFDHSDREDAQLEAVTLADIRRAAAQYLRPESVVVASIQPGS